MTLLFYKVFSFIGLLCCLHGQTHGNSSPEVYLIEKTEISFNNNTQFWSKISDFFYQKIKVFDLFMSNIINWMNYDEIDYLNVSAMPTHLFSKHANRKLEKNIPKRIPRDVNPTQAKNTLISQSTTLSSASSISKNITNDLSTTIIPSEKSSISHSTPLSSSTDSPLTSSIINLTSTTSTTDLPWTSTIEVFNDKILQNNTLNKDKINILSNTLPDEQNYYVVAAIFLSTIVLAIGMFLVYKKYLDSGRRAFYQIGGMCRNNIQEETPV